VKGTTFIFGLSILLIIPLACFLFVWIKGGNGRVKMPKYYGKMMGTQTINVRGTEKLDTVWQQVKSLPFSNQFGETVNYDSNKVGKILLMNFIYTADSTYSATSCSNMRFLLKRFKKADSMMHLVSVSVDPQRDSMRALRSYADALRIDQDKWWFCTSSAPSIKRFMHSELQMPDIKAEDTADNVLKNSKYWVVLDKDRNIRGYYNAIDTMEMRRCADDISLLILEKKPSDRNKKNKLDMSAFTKPKDI
jgi:protein SCO1